MGNSYPNHPGLWKTSNPQKAQLQKILPNFSVYGYSPKGPRALFLICLLSKHLLSIFCVSGSELGTWDTAVTKEAKVPVLMGLTMGG